MGSLQSVGNFRGVIIRGYVRWGGGCFMVSSIGNQMHLEERSACLEEFG